MISLLSKEGIVEEVDHLEVVIITKDTQKAMAMLSHLSKQISLLSKEGIVVEVNHLALKVILEKVTQAQGEDQVAMEEATLEEEEASSFTTTPIMTRMVKDNKAQAQSALSSSCVSSVA